VDSFDGGTTSTVDVDIQTPFAGATSYSGTLHIVDDGRRRPELHVHVQRDEK